MSELNPASTLAIAKLLRHHKELKQRQGLFQSRTVDFFRYKRFVRALESPEYKKKSSNQPDLYPPVTSSEDARTVFILLIKSQLVVPATKLHNHECKANGLKPNKDYPNLVLSNKATLSPNEYYVWNYNPKSFTDYVIVIAVIAILLALVCYPLWPRSMRRSSYYVSMGSLGLIVALLVIAVLRLILYVMSLLFVSKKTGGFWIFPNLFEDCGVLDSFKPLYGFGEVDSYSYQKKMKRIKRNLDKKNKIAQTPSTDKEDIEKEEKNNDDDTTKISKTPKLEEIPEKK
ncbi:Sec63 complex subunit SEC62 NDAI_0E02660 [Naumovozyma dairenensis CBS 421]|uniref:Translocation protein SEC62 n=1 Tax=Naumovozyma dairenensis (strain ATCC 10597 / BCRC 20456 / CBS 421 / NBRC 0211 / NRRL Y-12639) TaxID=1071378 RepID=G0WBG3_NAUDC|nr:hypothetical protein NDAI_0E02660 [Naumovozyma dairenensis CBS 421]CCD25083.1 hypothetical protein NDAI_0E02660 [Naumovozyma dairenensis CBS 421]